MDHRILCFTSLGFLLPILFYFFYREYSHAYTFLSTLIVSNMIASVFFWKDAIRNGIYHKIDAILARISFICCLGYIILYKHMTPFSWFLLV